jgi:Sulfotransferase family
MGAGRSGSTILGTALGNCPSAFFAGELGAYTARGGLPTNEDPSTEAFWFRVRQRLELSSTGPSPEWQRWFEHPSSLFRPRRRRVRSAYARFNECLYRAVAAEAQVPVVIDSSHYPLRRWRLRDIGIEVHTVHLVRHPVSVVRSLQTDISPKTRLAANVYLWIVCCLAELVYLRLRGGKSKVRYEDFVREPQAELARIGWECGLDPSAIRFDRLRTGPVFAGNRLIKCVTVALRPLVPAGADPADRLSERLQWVWIRRYGYRPWLP